jgi:hypothetical protein
MIMTDTQEVPHEEPGARAGYTYDPYSDPGQLGDLHNPNIPFHNYRQIHVSEVAFDEGFRATSPHDIPACPPKWGDVGHYWAAASIAGWLAAEFFTKSTTTGKLGGINWGSIVLKVVTGLGSVGVLELIKNTILPMVGITI